MRSREQFCRILLLALLFAMICTPSFAGSSGDGSGGLFWLLLGGGAVAGAAAIAKRQKAELSFAQKAKLSLGSQLGKILERGHGSAAVEQDAYVTVFAPEAAPPRAEVLIQVFVHVPASSSEARTISLNADPSSSQLASSPLALQLQKHDLIKVSLEASGAGITEPVQSLHWNGTLVCFSFEVRLPDTLESAPLRFKLRVFSNGVPAGTTFFNMKSAVKVEPITLVDQHAQTYKRPFLSYASQDRAQVLRAAQLIRALKMDFFQDLLTLVPGDHWQQRLFSEIDNCDLFLLFWSRNASESQWVRSEAEYALRRSRSSSMEIVPVLLEGPPAPLPPPSLEEIHFNDALQYVIFAEESSAKQHFKAASRKRWVIDHLINNFLYIPILLALAIVLIVFVLPR